MKGWCPGLDFFVFRRDFKGTSGTSCQRGTVLEARGCDSFVRLSDDLDPFSVDDDFLNKVARIASTVLALALMSERHMDAIVCMSIWCWGFLIFRCLNKSRVRSGVHAALAR